MIKYNTIICETAIFDCNVVKFALQIRGNQCVLYAITYFVYIETSREIRNSSTEDDTQVALRLSLISAGISNHMPSKVWDEISYPFSNFNGSTVEVWEWICNFTPHYIMDVITNPCWD